MAHDPYGSFGSVSDVNASGGPPLPAQDIRATPDMFGAQIGEAEKYAGKIEQQTGADAQKIATHYAQVATEAKVNDDFANKYAPAAAELRNQYDQLQGQDKVHGYEGYVNSLQDLNSQYMKGAKSPYEQELWNGILSKRLASETENAKNELVASQVQLSNKAASDKIMAQEGYAAANYNNPKIVDDVSQSINSTIALQHIDAGVNPNTSDGKAMIEQSQRAAQGSLAVNMINSAVSRGDAAEANNLRQKYGPVLPAHQQLTIDNILHAENTRQNGANGAMAIKNGQPLPPSLGLPPAKVQAIVADSAQAQGIDPNHALTVAMIESNMGQDLGKRGDIGQTGKGGNVNEQASNMVQELKKSQDVAQKALGRAPEPWETYTCYQQGASGGPALLKATTENPTAKAVDVLAPLYKDPKDALSAIVNNGGNASMTSGDYLAFLKKKYNDNMGRVLCVVPEKTVAQQPGPEGSTLLTQQQPASLGDAILAQHNTTGETVQPASTPRGELVNFDSKMPAMLERAQTIPNLAVRQAVIQNIKEQRATLASGAAAYSSTLINQAQKLAVDPTFTSMSQVPSELMSELLSENPATLTYMERRAEHNLAEQGGVATKDMKEYGSGMFSLMRDINEGKITGATELMKHLPNADGTGGDLTVSGFEKLQGLLTKDPQSAADTNMQTQAFKVIKRQLSGEDELAGIKDPKGEELFSRALPKLYKAIDDGKAKGLTMGELTDPGNKNWIGNIVQGLKRSPEQQSIDILGAVGEKPAGADKNAARTLSTIMQDYYATQDEDKRAALRKEAEDLGFVRKEGPSAPIAQ